MTAAEDRAVAERVARSVYNLLTGANLLVGGTYDPDGNRVLEFLTDDGVTVTATFTVKALS